MLDVAALEKARGGLNICRVYDGFPVTGRVAPGGAFFPVLDSWEAKGGRANGLNRQEGGSGSGLAYEIDVHDRVSNTHQSNHSPASRAAAA